jgi:CRP/FNR family transcriptional regulator, cyclic AMP receptor protein
MNVFEPAPDQYPGVHDGATRTQLHSRVGSPSLSDEIDRACGRDVCHRAVPVLGEVDLFHDLMEDSLRMLLASATTRSSAAGRVLFTPRDCGKVLYLLQDGTVHIFCLSTTGHKLVIGEFGAGTIFGTLALVGQGFYGVYAETLTPCSFSLRRVADVARVAQREPRLAWRLFQTTGEGLRRAMTLIETISFKTIPARLACMLADLCEAHGPIVDSFTHQELAERVGAFRETVSVLLSEFERAGALAVQPHRIHVLRLDALRDIASR